jgi:transcriptional regulator
MIVQGPQAYISPSYYPSKAVDGRVVPTWDYEAVHAYGSLSLIEDKTRLLQLVDGLTRTFEAERPFPWSVSDAPSDYIDRLLGAIVGVELTVTRVEGVRKLSQNRSEEDLAGVKAGLGRSDRASDQAVAALIGR